MITLPVSLGEAIDKLTILDIKCKRIADSDHSRREYDILKEHLKDYVDTYAFQYRLLYGINDEIWTMQDEIRNASSSYDKTPLCLRILNKNDERFRMKDTINKLSNSTLREQKGYPLRKAFFISHLGLGDHIGMNGAVRYVALQHDETHVVVKDCYKTTLAAMFADLPSVKLFIIPEHTLSIEQLVDLSQFSNVYRCGCYVQNPHSWEDLPNCFYRDMNIDPSVRHSHFHLPRTEASAVLFEPLRDMRYIFVQQKSSSHFTPLITWDSDEVLTIDPNKNMYEPDHRWYTLADSFVNRPFFDYINVIENADEIHVVESSFYCLASYLPLRARVKSCYARQTGALIPKYVFN
jgi:hypothetical protein